MRWVRTTAVSLWAWWHGYFFPRNCVWQLEVNTWHMLAEILDSGIPLVQGRPSNSTQPHNALDVSALEAFVRPLDTIISVILNTNWSGCRLYLVFILFYVILLLI